MNKYFLFIGAPICLVAGIVGLITTNVRCGMYAAWISFVGVSIALPSIWDFSKFEEKREKETKKKMPLGRQEQK